MVTIQEEASLFTEAKNSKDKFDTFFNMYMPLIRAYATRYSVHGEYDDLVQEASLGVIIAFRNFDPSRGVSFRHYCKFWIRNRLQDFCWRSSLLKTTREEYLAGVSPSVDSDQSTEIEKFGSVDDAFVFLETKETRDIVRRALRTLNKTDRKILKLYFGIGNEPKTYKEIGDEFGFSRQRTHQLVKAAEQKIKEQLLCSQ